MRKYKVKTSKGSKLKDMVSNKKENNNITEETERQSKKEHNKMRRR